jgi:hypothetical protein
MRRDTGRIDLGRKELILIVKKLIIRGSKQAVPRLGRWFERPTGNCASSPAACPELDAGRGSLKSHAYNNHHINTPSTDFIM